LTIAGGTGRAKIVRAVDLGADCDVRVIIARGARGYIARVIYVVAERIVSQEEVLQIIKRPEYCWNGACQRVGLQIDTGESSRQKTKFCGDSAHQPKVNHTYLNESAQLTELGDNLSSSQVNAIHGDRNDPVRSTGNASLATESTSSLPIQRRLGSSGKRVPEGH